MIIRIHNNELTYKLLNRMHGPFIASLLVGRLIEGRTVCLAKGNGHFKKKVEVTLLGKQYRVPKNCIDRVVVGFNPQLHRVPDKLKMPPYVPWPYFWYKRFEEENDQY